MGEYIKFNPENIQQFKNFIDKYICQIVIFGIQLFGTKRLEELIVYCSADKNGDSNKKKLIYGCEESFGAQLSDYVRDKDAIGTTLFVLEMALALKMANFTLYDLLKMLYNYYGVYKNYAFSITYDGLTGKEKMASIMKNLRKNPFIKLADIETEEVLDYSNDTSYNFKTKKKSKFDFPLNNTLKFIMSDKSHITIRPSGTEPKIKIYFNSYLKNLLNNLRHFRL